jgi:hypothetical protein
MTTAVRSLLEPGRPAIQVMRRTVRQHNGRLGPFFRGLLIGVALVIVISLVIG